jgi:Pectate lyase superfamily protein
MTDLSRRDFAALLALSAPAAVASMPERSPSQQPTDPAFSVRSCGAVGDGQADAHAAFLRCNAAATAARAGVHVPAGTYLVGSDLSVGHIHFDAGARLRPAAGATITLENAIDAGNWPIFDTSAGGTVVLKSATFADEAWWDRDPQAGDDGPALQRAIDAFAGRRGTLLLRRMVYRVVAAPLDVKHVNLVGAGVPAVTGGGGTTIRFTAPFGIHSSTEDNAGFSVSDMVIRGSENASQPQNGQVLLDFTGQNYPRATNVRLGYAETGLRLNRGVAIECHYGAFFNVQFDRCNTGALLQNAHSQKFFGGRFWDCAVGVVNVMSNDIALFGSEFESVIPVKHPGGGTSTPETTLICCRDESKQQSVIATGGFTVIGGGWSSYTRPAEFSAANGELTVRAVRSIGAFQDNQPVRPNYLRNAGLQLSTSGSTAPAWSVTAGTSMSELHSPYSRMLRLTHRGSATCVLSQGGVKLHSGAYTCGVGIARDNSAPPFAVSLVVSSGGAELQRAVIPGNYFGGIYRTAFTLPADGVVEFRVEFGNFANGDAYVYAPYICKGPNAERYSLARQEANPFEEQWGSSAPTSGAWRRGDKVWNTDPAPGQFAGWICIADGSPGTWRGFGAIAS